MALDATVAGASANSYLTEADADAIADTRIGPYATKWTAAASADKQKALQTATRDVDEHVGSTTVYVSTQALAFPRATDLDANDDPMILRVVKEATYEQAAYLLVNAKVLADAATRRARALFSFTEENVSGSVAVASDFGRFSPDAQRILASLPSEARGGIGSTAVHGMAWADEQGLIP